MPHPPASSSQSQPLLRSVRHARFSVAILMVVTVIMLLWNHSGMERVVEISAKNNVPVAHDDDQVGGLSESRLDIVDDKLRLTCKIVKKAEWPYCKYVAQMSPEDQGIDLSNFEAMTIDMTMTGPARSIKLSLINFETGSTKPDDWLSYKVNEIESIAIPASGKMRIPLNVFQTALWWKQQRPRRFDEIAVNVDRVVRAELVTAGENPPGDYVMELKSLRFHGKMISQNHLLIGLMVCWIGLALTWLGIAAFTLRRQLDSSHQSNQLLRQINNALELETKELSGQVYVDPLTGALNRQGLRAALIETSSMLANPMSVIFADIDHFKAVNDTHGHAVGDEVLQEFAKVFASKIRGTDKLVRWGGEEFLIVCTGTDAGQAVRLANKLRDFLHSHTWPIGLTITASFGVAQRDVNEEIGEVIKRADDKLYAAKANGRDRVEADLVTLQLVDYSAAA